MFKRIVKMAPNYNMSEEEFFSVWRPQRHIDEYFARKEERKEFENDKRIYISRQFEEALRRRQVDNTNDWYYKNGKWEVVK